MNTDETFKSLNFLSFASAILSGCEGQATRGIIFDISIVISSS